MISNEVLNGLEVIVRGNMEAMRATEGGLAHHQYHHLCYLLGAVQCEQSVRGCSPPKDEPAELDTTSNEPTPTPTPTPTPKANKKARKARKARKPKKLKNV